MNEILEDLAKKMLTETLENIRRLGFRVLFMEPKHKDISTPHIVNHKDVSVISEERVNRGDY